MKITEIEEVYWDQGYVIIENFFSESEIELFKRDFSDILRKAKTFDKTTVFKNSRFVLDQEHSRSHPKVRRVNWCIDITKSLAKLTAKKELKFIVSKLLNSKSFEQIICQTHYKLPNDGVSYPWHQDTQKDKGSWVDINGNGSFVLAMIAVDECKINNGTVKVIPKSHLFGSLDIESETSDSKNLIKVEPLIKKYGIKHLEMQPGSVAFIGPYTIHSSDENISQESRRMLMSGYIVPGSKNWENDQDRFYRSLRV